MITRLERECKSAKLSRMASWSPQQYLKFSDLRNRPCRDLAMHVLVPNACRVVDLGCGPGNLADIAPQYWPQASLAGIDSSPAMIETALKSHPSFDWRLGDIGEWASGTEQCDVVFSNAALQWLGDHASLFPRLFEHVHPGGALAVQMPGTYKMAQHQILRDMAAAKEWSRWFPAGAAKEWRAQDLDFYYDVLSPVASRLDLWATEYVQPVASVDAIVEFYKSTGLRPYLEPITDDRERDRFLAEYLEKLRPVFLPSANGMVLFPMRRIFMIAYR
jgi:trans-aconitate 2-methyltransferase